MRSQRARFTQSRRVSVELGEHAAPETQISLHCPVHHPMHDALDRSRRVHDHLLPEAVLHRVLVAQEVRVADADSALEPRASTALQLVENIANLDEVTLGIGAHLLRVCIELLTDRPKHTGILEHYFVPSLERANVSLQ